MTATRGSKAAQLLARQGASKGGKATAAKLTAEERTASARHAARVRWHGREAAEEAPRRRRLASAAIGDMRFSPLREQGLLLEISSDHGYAGGYGYAQTAWSLADAKAAVEWLQRWIAGQG
jgi:hypothetical protein